MSVIPPAKKLPTAAVRLMVLGLVVLLATWALSRAARNASASLR